MSRTVNPEKVNTLRDWVKRWPKASNLGIEPETREPAVYTADRSLVKTFPWERKADILTILADPSHFTADAVKAARDKYNEISEGKRQLIADTQASIQTAEKEIMRLWREHDVSQSRPEKTTKRSEIIAKEKELYDLVSDLNAALYAGRTTINKAEGTIAYVPVIPVSQRGLPMEVVLGGGQ
jgi:hypothetical protein